MADRTHIEWTDATWQIVTGCSVVSPGCTNCYAMRLAGTRLRHHPSRAGLTTPSKAGPVWNGKVRYNRQWLHQPGEWKRPRRIFVAAHGDLFHEGVSDDDLHEIFAVFASNPHHTFQVLTKRAERARDYLFEPGRLEDIYAHWHTVSGKPAEAQAWPLPNVWLGVSVEDQARADERIPLLLETPAAVRWISAEPLLGPVWLTRTSDDRQRQHSFLTGLRGVMHPVDGPDFDEGAGIDWVVAGGESGPGSRPMHPDWARRLRDQCAAAGVAFLFKQWGDHIVPFDGHRACRVCGCTESWACEDPTFGACAWAEADLCTSCVGEPTPAERAVRFHRIGKKASGRLLDGQLHDGFPEQIHG